MNLVGINRDLMAAAGPGLTPYNFVPASPELPCIYVGLPDQMTEFSSYGSCTVDLKATVAVSRADEETAQMALQDILTIELIARFLQAKSEFWTEVGFKSISNFRSTTFGNAECLAADVNLTIRTT